MKIIKSFAAVLSLIAILILTACSSNSSTSSEKTATNSATARTLEEIKQSGTVKIGVFSDKKPFGYVDEKATSKDMIFTLEIA